MTKKTRDEAIERVGQALYGHHWIGELAPKEWRTGKDNGSNHRAVVPLPSAGKSAARIATACFRSRASKEQFEQAIHWLHEQGFDLAPSTFDAQAFEQWFRKKFPEAPVSSTTLRVNAVCTELRAGRRPGRGGNIGWNEFCDLIRTKSRQRCDDRTIKRDVDKVRA
jgi:hypothetical protein